MIETLDTIDDIETGKQETAETAETVEQDTAETTETAETVETVEQGTAETAETVEQGTAETAETVEQETAVSGRSVGLEQRGRRWLIMSFLFCPCHLPVTLTLLAVVLGGTAIGSALKDNALLAGVVISSVWIYGTARGLRYIHKAKRGELTCELPGARHRLSRLLWP